jgi:hypothetical protein
VAAITLASGLATSSLSPVEGSLMAKETEQQTQDAANPENQIRVEVDDSSVDAQYANWCRVSITPEEVILDLALNPNPLAQVQKFRISQRVILNFFWAKRLAALLSETVQRHERAFGKVETDFRKRLNVTEATPKS